MSAERPTFYEALDIDVSRSKSNLESAADVFASTFPSLDTKDMELFSGVFPGAMNEIELGIDWRAEEFEHAVERKTLAEESQRLTLTGGASKNYDFHKYRIHGILGESNVDIEYFTSDGSPIGVDKAIIGDSNSPQIAESIARKYLGILVDRNEWESRGTY